MKEEVVAKPASGIEHSNYKCIFGGWDILLGDSLMDGWTDENMFGAIGPRPEIGSFYTAAFNETMGLYVLYCNFIVLWCLRL